MENNDSLFVTLVDEDGVEREFEHIDTIELDNQVYCAFIPVYDDPDEYLQSESEVVILKVVTDENGDDLLVTIEDDDEFEKASAEFERSLEDEYEFSDDEEEE